MVPAKSQNGHYYNIGLLIHALSNDYFMRKKDAFQNKGCSGLNYIKNLDAPEQIRTTNLHIL